MLMARNRDDKDIADFLYCSSVLEEKVFLLYMDLAEKIELPLPKSLLLHMAYDSQKHSALLRGISETIGKPERKPRNCEKNLVNTWKMVNVLSQEIGKKDRILRGEFSSLAGQLAVLERTLGEDYYILAQAKTLQFMDKKIREEYGISLENLEIIFENIIHDEETHGELVSIVKKILNGEETPQIKDNTPLVKYQNPDAW